MAGCCIVVKHPIPAPTGNSYLRSSTTIVDIPYIVTEQSPSQVNLVTLVDGPAYGAQTAMDPVITSGNVQIAKGADMYMLITELNVVYTCSTLGGAWQPRSGTNIEILSVPKVYDAYCQRLIYTKNIFIGLFDSNNDAISTKVAYSADGDTWTHMQISDPTIALLNTTYPFKYYVIYLNTSNMVSYIGGCTRSDTTFNIFVLLLDNAPSNFTLGAIDISNYTNPDFKIAGAANFAKAAFFVSSGARVIGGGYMGSYYMDNLTTATYSPTSGRNAICGKALSNGDIIIMDINFNVKRGTNNGSIWSSISQFTTIGFSTPFITLLNSTECMLHSTTINAFLRFSLVPLMTTKV